MSVGPAEKNTIRWAVVGMVEIISPIEEGKINSDGTVLQGKSLHVEKPPLMARARGSDVKDF